MDQHKQFHPNYGPDPWGAKLKGLDELIPAASAPPASAPATAPATAPAEGPASP
jgi:hypothetical protein